MARVKQLTWCTAEAAHQAGLAMDEMDGKAVE
jgi:hypothetical protein